MLDGGGAYIDGLLKNEDVMAGPKKQKYPIGFNAASYASCIIVMLMSDGPNGIQQAERFFSARNPDLLGKIEKILSEHSVPNLHQDPHYHNDFSFIREMVVDRRYGLLKFSKNWALSLFLKTIASLVVISVLITLICLFPKFGVSLSFILAIYAPLGGISAVSQLPRYFYGWSREIFYTPLVCKKIIKLMEPIKNNESSIWSTLNDKSIIVDAISSNKTSVSEQSEKSNNQKKDELITSVMSVKNLSESLNGSDYATWKSVKHSLIKFMKIDDPSFLSFIFAPEESDDRNSYQSPFLLYHINDILSHLVTKGYLLKYNTKMSNNDYRSSISELQMAYEKFVKETYKNINKNENGLAYNMIWSSFSKDCVSIVEWFNNCIVDTKEKAIDGSIYIGDVINKDNRYYFDKFPEIIIRLVDLKRTIDARGETSNYLSDRVSRALKSFCRKVPKNIIDEWFSINPSQGAA